MCVCVYYMTDPISVKYVDEGLHRDKSTIKVIGGNTGGYEEL